MPLSFRSESHGTIAFGFFNIESDMLLLDRYFFFADDFCQWMIQLAEPPGDAIRKICCQVYCIDSPGDIGDLMGAIHGVRFEGFIGRLYQRFPFPENPAGFKQNPGGDKTQAIVRDLINSVSKTIKMDIEFLTTGQVLLGPYLFDTSVFHELIRYVWQGGYPRWKDEKMPEYVSTMKKKVQKSDHPFFKGV